MQQPEVPDRHPKQPPQRSEFVDAMRKGVLIGLALLVVVLPPVWKHRMQRQAQQAQVAVAPPQPGPGQGEQERQRAPGVAPPATAPESPAPEAAAPQPPSDALPPVRLADFRGEYPSPDARLVANWVLTTHNHQNHSFVIVDKKDARVYVFSPRGQLTDSAPALLGSARGDDSFPGIGDKPLAQVRPEEKTTPAGRFVAQPGLNAGNEDVVWVDYDAAVSMHRIRPLVARERRLERLASLTIDDNRISFGCINLPVSFYENVLSPAVRRHGAVIYVLPEVKSVQQVFGAFDVTDPVQLAAARRSVPAAGVQKVALTPAGTSVR